MDNTSGLLQVRYSINSLQGKIISELKNDSKFNFSAYIRDLIFYDRSYQFLLENDVSSVDRLQAVNHSINYFNEKLTELKQIQELILKPQDDHDSVTLIITGSSDEHADLISRLSDRYSIKIA